MWYIIPELCRNMPSHFWCTNLFDILGNYLSIWKNVSCIAYWIMIFEIRSQINHIWKMSVHISFSPRLTFIVITCRCWSRSLVTTLLKWLRIKDHLKSKSNVKPLYKNQRLIAKCDWLKWHKKLTFTFLHHFKKCSSSVH